MAQSSGLTRRSIFAAAGMVILPGFLTRSDTAQAVEPLQSAWSKASHSEVRLIAGGPVTGRPGAHRAGIAFRMNTGFKTYWRHPGDSGVPPVIRFDGSENLASAEVRFPAPLRFADGAGGYSFGYAGPEVILPVDVVATDPGKPVLLRMHIDYAVCEKLCVPASGKADLVLSDRTPQGGHSRLLLAQQRIPILQKLGEGSACRVVGLRKADKSEHFQVDIAGSGGSTPTLIVEGEEPWFLETKDFTPHGKDTGSFLVAVIERSKALDCTGAELTLTLMDDNKAIEVRTRLDLALVTP